MAHKSVISYREWTNPYWSEGMQYEPTQFNPTLSSTLSSAYDNSALLKTTSTATANADHVIRLPDTKTVVRLILQDKRFTHIRFGTDFVNGSVINESANQPTQEPVSGVSTTMTQRAGMFASPTGLMLASAANFETDSWWSGSNLGFAAVMKADGTGIDPDKLLFWSGSWRPQSSADSIDQARYGAQLNVGLFDWTQNAVVARAVTTFPVMYLSNFVKSVDGNDGKLYGTRAFSPFPPYPEVPFFRVFPSDVYSNGQLAQAERSYLILDPNNTAAHQALANAYPYAALPVGNNGRLGIHWVQ